MDVRWIDEYGLWEYKSKENYYIVPRYDEDGIDIFFAKGKIVNEYFDGITYLRFCSGENYLVEFVKIPKEDREIFNRMIKIIKEKTWRDKFAEKVKSLLPDRI